MSMDLSSDSDSTDDIIDAINSNLKDSVETKRACNKEPAEKKEVKEKESTHSIESTPHTPVESHKSQSPDKTKVSPRKSKRNEKSSESNLEEEYKFYSKVITSARQLGWIDIYPYLIGNRRKHTPCYWPIRTLTQEEINESSFCTTNWNEIKSGKYLVIEALGWETQRQYSTYMIGIEEFIGWSDPQVSDENFKEGGKSPLLDRQKKSKYSNRKYWVPFERGVRIAEYMENYISTSSPLKRIHKPLLSVSHKVMKEKNDKGTTQFREFQEKVTETLEAGEIISFYYAPLNQRCTTKIMAIHSKGLQQLHLENNYVIDELCVVQKKMNKQKEPVSINFEKLAGIGCSKPLSHFLLIDSSLKDSDPSQMDRIGRLRKEIDEIREEFK